MSARALAGPLVLSVVLTLLNCLKPLQGDEAAYWAFARHIAQHPFDPYGFRFPGEVAANHVLAPPVLLWWWGLAIRLFGEHFVLWKLWLFPFSLLLVLALRSLFSRFCDGLQTPLLWFSVLSPTILPCFGLMLDVPALALSLTAIVLMLRAEGGNARFKALAAGVVLGVAMQTKYTAFVTVGVLLLCGLSHRRLGRSILACATGVALFAAWEATTAHLYGEAHFLHAVRRPQSLQRPLQLLMPLLSVAGSAAPGIGMLALAALRPSRRTIFGAAAAGICSFLTVLFLPSRFTDLSIPTAGRPIALPVDKLVFGALGIAVVGLICRVSSRLLGERPEPMERGESVWPPLRADDFFLVGWLFLELGGYFALSPWPGVRRILALVVVATLLAGRLARRARTSPRLIQGIVLGHIALGLAVYTVDIWDARADLVAARKASRWLAAKPTEARAWFAAEGWCGFQYYADRAGFTILGKPDVPPPAHGDLVAVLHRFSCGKTPESQNHWGTLLGQFRLEDRVPWRTDPCFYSRRQAIEHQDGPRVEVKLYRLP
jgi:hypothetical protein